MLDSSSGRHLVADLRSTQVALLMQPQIDFSHVLQELSVNRNDPCEVVRELISNSYDAKSKMIFYAPLQDCDGLIFLDTGTGLSPSKKKNDITPWQAFFSIGRSTKKKGEVIGYKCQGSKLCFACSRIFVATRNEEESGAWYYKTIDNPRVNLNVNFDLSPAKTNDISHAVKSFFAAGSASTYKTIDVLLPLLEEMRETTGTLILIDSLDTEDFVKYFAVGADLSSTYIFNYIRFSTCHGDIRWLTKEQGFSNSQILQLSNKLSKADLYVFTGEHLQQIAFGFPYLAMNASDPTIKTPAQISRLRDGRFACRAAKTFSIGQSKFSLVLAIDGNKRAHDEYNNLDRRGGARSGIKLTDQRGCFISVKGIKICKYYDIFSAMPDFAVLGQGDSYTNYTMIIDGDFDLVTNRNSLSKKAFDTLCDPAFVAEIEKFLTAAVRSEKIFGELLLRLRRESNESLLNEQIEILDRSKLRLKKRERFYLKDRDGKEQMYLSPLPGEEYLVGVLYANLGFLVTRENPLSSYWERILTFSTQGIDSLAMRDSGASHPLADGNINAVEYKYEFGNGGPFNHSLAIVDRIVAWNVDLNQDKIVKDTYTCTGSVRKADNSFEWLIDGIETEDGARFTQTISVVCLRNLIAATFPDVRFRPEADDIG